MSTPTIGISNRHLKALIEEILFSKYPHCLIIA